MGDSFGVSTDRLREVGVALRRSRRALDEANDQIATGARSAVTGIGDPAATGSFERLERTWGPLWQQLATAIEDIAGALGTTASDYEALDNSIAQGARRATKARSRAHFDLSCDELFPAVASVADDRCSR